MIFFILITHTYKYSNSANCFATQQQKQLIYTSFHERETGYIYIYDAWWSRR